MTRRLKTVEQVAAWRLCMGCGVCAAVCENNAIRMVDEVAEGIRPRVDADKCESCGRCMEVCPGIEIRHGAFDDQAIAELRQSWGPVLEVWEGYSCDSEIRLKSSSGGAATALALFCLEAGGMEGMLHIKADQETAIRNVSVMSRNRQELMEGVGSRYGPVAACEKINWIAKASAPCVFVGKPCDVAALRKAQALNSELDEKVGLAISIFCAGTPSSQGTNRLLEALRTVPKEVEELSYRGNGWPGPMRVKLKGQENEERQMGYEQSWGEILSRYVPLRCRLCPDGTGEFADIACGDPWYRQIEADDPGRSLVLVRTEKGKKVLAEAMRCGYLELHPVDRQVLAQSQKSLLWKRCNLWGRLWAMRMLSVPRPQYEGFSLEANWGTLSLSARVRAVAGTFRRFLQRGWVRPSEYNGQVAKRQEKKEQRSRQEQAWKV